MLSKKYVCSIFTPFVSDAPIFFSGKKNKKTSENSSPRGLAPSHTSKLETYPTSLRPPRPLAVGRFGKKKSGGSHGPGFAPPKTGVTSPPKMMGSTQPLGIPGIPSKLEI